MEIFEFVDLRVFKESNMIFKCKASAIIKIFSFFQIANLEPISGDTIIIPENYYYEFLFNWMHCAQNNQIDSMMKHLFRGLIILLQNSMLLEFTAGLSGEEKERRRYE